MKIRWYLLIRYGIALCLVGMSLLFWVFTTKNTRTVRSVPTIQTDTPGVNSSQKQTDTPGVNSSQKQTEDDNTFILKNLTNVRSFEELEQLYPDAPLVAAFHSMFTDEDRAAMDAEAKRAYEIIASGEFFDFLATKPTTKESDKWWAERGFFADPDRFKKAFREYFPTGEPEDYEPEMRAKYAALFEGITAENETELVFANASKFITDSRNQAWIQGYFNREGISREETLTAWTSGIRQELIQGHPSTGEIIPDSVQVEFAIPHDSDGFPEEAPLQEVNTVIDVEPPESSEDAFPADAGPQKGPKIITADTLDTLELPELPTAERIETQLREQLNPERFSPQRLNTAMQTLNQYGPEEGVRRLKASDPEMAKIVERHLAAKTEPIQ